MPEEDTPCIYSIYNIVSKMYYIGQTKNFYKRKMSHIILLRKNSHKNTHLQNSWNFYGEENFIFEIIDICDDVKERNVKEVDYIKKFNSLSPNGYNLASGGNASSPSEESRMKMSISKKGMILSDEWRANISKATSGENNPMYGKKHSEKTIEKIKESLLGQMDGEKNPFYGKSHSEETKEKISKSNKGKKRTEEQKMNVKEKNAKLGIKNYWYGKNLPDYLCKIISERQTGKFGKENNAFGKKRKDSPSVYIGVRKEKGKWLAMFKLNKEDHRIGLFNCELDAAIAHDKYVFINQIDRPTNFSYEEIFNER